MNNLEQELRRALQPRDPGDEFTRRVMARVAPSQQPVRRLRIVSNISRWVPAALAASLLVSMFVGHERHTQESLEEGLRAREQLLLALRMTSEKLDVAYQVVHAERRDDDTDSGA